jgi:type III restriction enzyme
MSDKNPILNNPYEEPKRHYATDPDGNLNYADIRKGRRVFQPDMPSIPSRQGPQQSMFEVNDFSPQWDNELVNMLRKEVGAWRAAEWPQVTRVTGELLRFWFANPERQYDKRVFFAQREAIESAIWLNEVAAKSNAGQNIQAQTGHSSSHPVTGRSRF